MDYFVVWTDKKNRFRWFKACMLFNLIMNFISPYSLSTMLRPVTLSCGHSGCQDCLAKLSAMATHPRCPLCKKNIDSDLNINFSLHAITSHFEVYCTNDGCQWKGNFGYSEEQSNMSKVKTPMWKQQMSPIPQVRRNGITSLVVSKTTNLLFTLWWIHSKGMVAQT